MNTVNRKWLFAFAALVIAMWPFRAFSQALLGEDPDHKNLPVPVSRAAAPLAAQAPYKVRIIYLIPSNREPQPKAIQTIQRHALRTQTLFRFKLSTDAYAASRKADALLVSCGALKTIDLIVPVEDVIKVPVISSTPHGLWHGVKMLGVKARVQGYGMVMAKG